MVDRKQTLSKRLSIVYADVYKEYMHIYFIYIVRHIQVYDMSNSTVSIHLIGNCHITDSTCASVRQ